ncbi:MAG: type IVa pilus pseudopilin TppE [Gammaproteobacteria bacterium]|nr:MAG: type IVa pilus pseudopilin TppE [Gammaproteobacteria bacterium]
MRKLTGFTLIELLITITIAAILSAVAAPSFSRLIRDTRLTTSANNLVSVLNLARSESAKRGANVFVQADSGTTAWESGWTVYVDTNGNAAPDAGEVTRVAEALDGTLTLAGSVAVVQFRPTGTTTVAPTPVTFDLCNNRPAEPDRRISISATGHVSVATITCP